MAKFKHIQNNFTSGEVSERFKGRTDLREYNQSLETCENFLVGKLGGVYKRPGTQFIADLDTFPAGKAVPFIFSQDEAYTVILDTENNNIGSANSKIQIYKNDGTKATVDDTAVYGSLGDASNWKYAQSGDILVLTFSDGQADSRGVPPIVIYRTDDLQFTAYSWLHPDFIAKLPSTGLFAPGAQTPYLDSNVDPAIRMFVDVVATGTGRTVTAVDASNLSIPFFKRGHSYGTDSGFPTRFGAFFAIQKAGTEGVLFGDDWEDDVIIPPAGIDTAADELTITGHAFSSGDICKIYDNNGSDVITIAGITPVNGFYGEFYTRLITANTIALYPTLADARADTNRYDITAKSGDILENIRVEYFCMDSMSCTITVAMEGTLTSAANASDDWKESAWSNEQGFPRTVSFHEQRLYFGGTNKQPDTIWASQLGNVYSFRQTNLEQDTTTPSTSFIGGYPYLLAGSVLATDPFNFSIAAKQANIIQWMESQNTLQVGTTGSEYIISGSGGAISNESIDVKKQTDIGSTNVASLSINNSTMFVTRDGRRLREFKFNEENGSYLSTNVSVLGEHMVFSGFGGTSSDVLKGINFEQMIHQPSRDLVWLLTSSNKLISVTISRESNIVAWAYHPIKSTDSIKSMTVIPAANDDFDELWLTIERSVNGSTKQYLEKMGDDFEHTFLANTSTDNNDIPYYVDSAVVVNLGSSTDTVTLPLNDAAGTASHLEGETVAILAGNVVESQKTVSSGQVVLDATYPAGTRVVVGLPYSSTLKTLDIEAGADLGSAQGDVQRIDKVTARLYRAQKGQYKNPEGSTYEFEYDDNEVYSGITELDFDISPDIENQVVILHNDPVPFNILSMVYRGVTYDS